MDPSTRCGIVITIYSQVGSCKGVASSFQGAAISALEMDGEHPVVDCEFFLAPQDEFVTFSYKRLKKSKKIKKISIIVVDFFMHHSLCSCA